MAPWLALPVSDTPDIFFLRIVPICGFSSGHKNYPKPHIAYNYKGQGVWGLLKLLPVGYRLRRHLLKYSTVLQRWYIRGFMRYEYGPLFYVGRL